MLRFKWRRDRETNRDTRSTLQPPARLDQDPGETRVFLSYSRSDKPMADWLRRELESAGVEVFRDIEDTLPGEEWWHRLRELIALADTIVFLLSPRSAVSKVCADEVAYARSLNKRIFPAIMESVDWRAVPEGLAKIHSVNLSEPKKRQQAVTELIAALLTDISWVREHTRLLDRARQWLERERTAAELLTSEALGEAERWLTRQPKSAEPPTSLHQEYIKASRDAERAEQQRRLRESEAQREAVQEQRDRAERALTA